MLPVEVPPGQLERRGEDGGRRTRGIRCEELCEPGARLLLDLLDGQRPLPELDEEQLRRFVQEVFPEGDWLLIENPLPAIAHAATFARLRPGRAPERSSSAGAPPSAEQADDDEIHRRGLVSSSSR